MLFDEKRASCELAKTLTNRLFPLLCSILRLFIQFTILRHIYVENSNHVQTFLLLYHSHFNDFSHIFELTFRALKKNPSPNTIVIKYDRTSS